jgi:light-regulated signal transduction histidine kinase (bacteriophytochrome)
MQQLINDLLAFSRVGRSTGELGPVDLEHVLWQALRQLEITLSDTGAVVTHDRLPTVLGDQSLLVQLMQNLIGNGVKFRAGDDPRVHIGVQPAPDAAMWEFSCSDNGIGIEPQYEDKIFVIFQRLHGRDVYGGTGIGLAMCKKIVEHHGGRIWLDTEAASPGTTFRWTLPVTKPVGAPDPPRQPAVAAGPAGPDPAGQDEQSLDAAMPTDTPGRTEMASDDTGDRSGAGGRDLARGGRPG